MKICRSYFSSKTSRTLCNHSSSFALNTYHIHSQYYVEYFFAMMRYWYWHWIGYLWSLPKHLIVHLVGGILSRVICSMFLRYNKRLPNEVERRQVTPYECAAQCEGHQTPDDHIVQCNGIGGDINRMVSCNWTFIHFKAWNINAKRWNGADNVTFYYDVFNFALQCFIRSEVEGRHRFDSVDHNYFLAHMNICNADQYFMMLLNVLLYKASATRHSGIHRNIEVCMQKINYESTDMNDPSSNIRDDFLHAHFVRAICNYA